jgi:tetratricopeptide (TPR) repeat protein
MTSKSESVFDRYTEGLKLIGAARVNEAEQAFFEVIAHHLDSQGAPSAEEKAHAAESFFQAAAIANGMGEVAVAAAFYRRALALGNVRPEAALGLATALMHCNRIDEAEAALAKVADPAFTAEVRWRQGHIALKRRKPAEAEALFREALKGLPSRAEIEIDVALALEGQGKVREAAEAAAAASRQDSGLYDRFLDAADRAFTLDQEGLAMWNLARAEKTAPAQALTWFLLGARYYQVGALPEAERAYLASLNLGASLNTYRDLAALMEQSNRLKQAANIARAGLRFDPDDGMLLNVLAECRARQGAAEDALAMFRGVAEKAAHPSVRSKAELSAGKILDSLGRAEEAYQAFCRARELQKSAPEFAEFDHQVSQRHVEESLAAARAPAPPLAFEKGPDEPRQLAFFVGFPRSGTTLLQEVMQAHPEIAVAEEKLILSAILILLRKLTQDEAPLSALTAGKARLLREVYFLQASALAPSAGKPVFVDKLPLSLVYLPAIRAIFPDAKIILGLRHPCSVALSCLMQDFKLNNFMINMMSLDSITHFYANVLQVWQETRKAQSFEALEVKYEDVVANLEKEARRVSDFLGVRFAEEMLAYAEGAKAKGLIRTPSYAQVVKPIYGEAVERWKSYRAHLEPFLGRLRPYIKAFGYSE